MNWQTIVFLAATVCLSTATQCSYKNRRYSNGATWWERDFQMKCNTNRDGSWKVEPSGCRWPRNGMELRSGETKRDGNYQASCYPDGNSLRFRERVINGGETRPDMNAQCTYKGRKYNNGAEWSEGSYKMRCSVKPDGSWQVRPVTTTNTGNQGSNQAQCVYHNRKYSNGNEWYEGSYKMRCIVNPDGSWEVKPVTGGYGGGSSQVKCQDNGQSYNIGSTYNKGNFQYRCNSRPGGGWQTEVVGCYWPRANRRMSPGQTLTHGGYEGRCTNERGQIYFGENPKYGG